MNVKRLMVILLVLGIALLNGCKMDADTAVATTVAPETEVVSTETTSVEVTSVATTAAETTTEEETTTAASTTSTTKKTTTTTAKKTTTTTKKAAAGKYLSIEKEMLNAVNAERAKEGKSALTLSDEVCECAKIRAKELVTDFSHYRPDGSSCFTVLEGITYYAGGENIAYGQKDVTQVMTSWMNSEGHRRNIMSDNFNKLGCAAYSDGGRIYWVQLFIYS